MRKRLRQQEWFSNTVALCLAILFFIFLWHFPDLRDWFKKMLGYFQPVIMGGVIAYLINPLVNFFDNNLRFIRKESLRYIIGVVLSFLLLIIIFIFLIITILPQLIESITGFVLNMNGNVHVIIRMIEDWNVSYQVINFDNFINSSEDILSEISSYLRENLLSIINSFAIVSKNLLQWLIAFILSFYFMSDKPRLKVGFRRLLKASVKASHYEEVSVFLQRCHNIFNRYIIYSLLDAVIVGMISAIFMMSFGMQYVVLTSFVVALTNLVPTFGPIIGAILSGFILLMDSPVHALTFIIFTLVLQTIDGYVIKPKLFGSSLGVSGLWILIGILVGGNMFGIVGILLAIPVVAVLDFIYSDYLIPKLENWNKDR